MVESTKAIILQVVDYSDSQAIVHAYTSEYGRLLYYIKEIKIVKKQCSVSTLLVETALYSRYLICDGLRRFSLKPFIYSV